MVTRSQQPVDPPIKKRVFYHIRHYQMTKNTETTVEATVEASTPAQETKAPRAQQDKQAPKAPRRPQSTAELDGLRTWLASLELGAIRPTVKVNGPYHPTAIITIDLGQPVKQVRLNSEQSSELGQRLRRTAREILGRDATIRISADNSHGIHWASVSS